jgi:hypothetical protein
MPSKALMLRHSQNNKPSALGAAYFGNAATLVRLHINVYGLNTFKEAKEAGERVY